MLLKPFWLIDSRLQSFFIISYCRSSHECWERSRRRRSQVIWDPSFWCCEEKLLFFFAPGFRESWGCEEGEILSLVVELEKTQLWRSLPSCVRTGMGYAMMISSTQPVQWISLMRDNSILHDISYRPRQLRMLRKTAARTGICWISLSYDQTIQGSTWHEYSIVSILVGQTKFPAKRGEAM